MAQPKRQPDRLLSSHSKRQRLTKGKEPPAAKQHHRPDEDEPVEEYRIDSQFVTASDEILATNIAERLTAANLHADQRKIWAKDFEKEVLNKKTSLTTKIDDAKQRLSDKHEAFRKSVLPVLSAALQDSCDLTNIPSTVQLPLQLKLARTTKLATRASQLLKDCQTILACYEQLAEAGSASSSVAKIKETLAEDKRALETAVTGARKMVLNHIQTQTGSQHSKAQAKFNLNEEEISFGRKIMKNSHTAQNGQTRDVPALSDVCHDLGKAVNKMQRIVEM